jgi:hypothetical protein
MQVGRGADDKKNSSVSETGLIAVGHEGLSDV